MSKCLATCNVQYVYFSVALPFSNGTLLSFDETNSPQDKCSISFVFFPLHISPSEITLIVMNFVRVA